MPSPTKPPKTDPPLGTVQTLLLPVSTRAATKVLNRWAERGWRVASTTSHGIRTNYTLVFDGPTAAERADTSTPEEQLRAWVRWNPDIARDELRRIELGPPPGSAPPPA